MAQVGQERLPHCSTGCSIHVDQNEEQVYRLRPRSNPQAQGHFMCDEGRFGWKYVNDEERLLRPMVRSDGHLIPVSWDAVLPALKSGIERAGENRRPSRWPGPLAVDDARRSLSLGRAI